MKPSVLLHLINQRRLQQSNEPFSHAMALLYMEPGGVEVREEGGGRLNKVYKSKFGTLRSSLVARSQYRTLPCDHILRVSATHPAAPGKRNVRSFLLLL